MTATRPRPHDSFPLPRFEERLWEELAHAHPAATGAETAGRPRSSRRLVPFRLRRAHAVAPVGADRATPAAAASSGGPVRTAGHPPARRYLIAVAALAAASAVVVAVVADGGGPDTEAGDRARAEPSPTTEPGEPSETSPLPEPVAAPDAVVVEEMRFADGTTATVWADEATGASRRLQYDATGAPGFEQAITVVENPDATATEVDVDHATAEYEEFPPHAFAGVNTRRDDALGEQVDSGQLVADGREVVEGRELLRFVSPPSEGSSLDCSGLTDPAELSSCQETNQSMRFAATGTTVVLVDPATFRPVSETQSGGAGGDRVTTYTYLARTPENLALLNLAIPDGYTQVDELSRGLG